MARIGELIERAGLQPRAASGGDPEILAAALDSRRVESGSLFFALAGLRSDGEAFVADAVAGGARAIVAASPRPDDLDDRVAWIQLDDPRLAAALLSRELWERPDTALQLVGITGTNGKTTVSFLLESIVRAAARPVGRIGTIGTAYGDVTLPASHTTPEAPDFYELLARMRDAGIELVAMEVSSHALAMRRVAGARFVVAAFLNLSPEHLDFHGDEHAYFEAKALLFDGLSNEATAVVSVDEPHGEAIRERARPARVIGFGRDERADVRLRDEHVTLRGASAVLDLPSGPIPIRTHLVGRFNLENVAAAAACAVALGLPADAITRGVGDLASIPGRMERVDCGQPFAVIVDYAHTEDALQSLLETIAPLCEGSVHLVFGCGGSRDRGKRAPMGRVAARLAHRVYLTSDNPRDEDPAAIIASVTEGIASVSGGPERTRTIVDRRDAIAAALGAAGAGDVVVVAGKGHETTQIFRDRTEPFDDREVCRELLASRKSSGGAPCRR